MLTVLSQSLPKKVSLIVVLLFSAVSFGYAQIDTIYTNTEKIACLVKEIAPESVTYMLPGEDVANSIYKNTIQKIVFKNGRVQTFATTTAYKAVASVRDFDNVTIANLESDVKGLIKLGDVSALAKGGTIYASRERVKQRAYKDLKIQAAMMGANVILLVNQATEGNKYSYSAWGGSGSPTETSLNGLAYTTTLPDYQALVKLIGDRKELTSPLQYYIGENDSDMSADADERLLKIAKITNENGIITLEGELKGEKAINSFRVVNVSESRFALFYKKKNTYYNIIFQFDGNQPQL